MKTLLKVYNLGIGHTDFLQKELNFEVQEGEIILIKGDNGVGKSSLVKTILGHQCPLQGKIDWRIPKEKLCLLPQLVNQDFPLSITLKEILESFPLHRKVMAMLDPHLQKRRWADASGGEKQKTLLLTRLQKKTEFLVLDEPFNHMDEKNIDEIITLLFDLIQKKILKGILLTGHTCPNNQQMKMVKELELS